jgi:hypothetical protein
VWTHVPVLQLWPAAQKAGTGLLPHLPTAHQGCHQDLQAVAWPPCHLLEALRVARQHADPRQGEQGQQPSPFGLSPMVGSDRQAWRQDPGGCAQARFALAQTCFAPKGLTQEQAQELPSGSLAALVTFS